VPIAEAVRFKTEITLKSRLVIPLGAFTFALVFLCCLVMLGADSHSKEVPSLVEEIHISKAAGTGDSDRRITS
jgi:hypothetical protein